MASDLTHDPYALTWDLSGLPEPVIERVKQLVQDARMKQVSRCPQGDAPGIPVQPPLAEPFPKFLSRPRPSLEELEALLDELSAGPAGKILPPDFSRADIYDDQD